MKMMQWLSRFWAPVFCLVLASCSTLAPVADSTEHAEQTVATPVDQVSTRVTVAAVGDMMLGGRNSGLLEREGYDYPFAATAHLLQQADIAIGNLETPLTDRGALLVEKTYRFRNPPDKVAPALQRAGFDIVSLANNHSLDYGYQGLRDTFDALTQNDVHYHGAGENSPAARKPVIFELPNAQRAGFLAYSNTLPEEFWAGSDRPGTAFGHERHVKEDVGRLHAQGVDIIVVSFHWGQERSTQLRDYQPMLAHAAIDAGADLVIGHHPHILQGVEKYKSGLILYSLGNYTFGTYSSAVRHSAVATIVFENGVVSRLELVPININNFEVELQPRVLQGEAARQVFDDMASMSAALGVQLQFRDGVIELNTQ